MTIAELDSPVDAQSSQWRFEQLRTEAVRRRGGRLLDLSYANPLVELDPRVRSVLIDVASTLPESALQYSPYGGATKPRRLIATDLARRTDLPFTYRDVVLTSGATAALSIVFGTAFKPGDEVVLFSPCWLDYPLYLQALGVRWRFVSLTAQKRLDLDALTAAISPSTAGVVLSQPQSPTGVVLSGNELQGLADVLARASDLTGRSLLLVSDEAHRDVTWTDRPVLSPLQFYPHTTTIYSFGKAWRIQGQRFGYAAVSPRSPIRTALSEALVERSRTMGFGCPNTLMQEVGSRLLRLDADTRWLADAQRFARGVLVANGYEVIDASATMFVYARAPIADDWRFVAWLAEAGVLVLPSSLFHEPGYFRISLNVSERQLEAIADALAGVARRTHARG
jgi:aspartate aminotransferase